MEPVFHLINPHILISHPVPWTPPLLPLWLPNFLTLATLPPVLALAHSFPAWTPFPTLLPVTPCTSSGGCSITFPQEDCFQPPD